MGGFRQPTWRAMGPIVHPRSLFLPFLYPPLPFFPSAQEGLTMKRQQAADCNRPMEEVSLIGAHFNEV